MNSTIKTAALIAGLVFSSALFAGNQPATGGGGQGTGATTNGATAGSAMISAVAANGAIVNTAPNGTITISGGSTGGISFPQTTVTHAGKTYTVSADNGVITLVPAD